MRRFLLALLFLLCLPESKSQAENKPITKSDYLKKSKNQSTAAWILVCGGGVMVTAGAIIVLTEGTDTFVSIFTGDVKEPSAAGPVLFFTGAASLLGSIPLFIASSKNKRIANKLTTFLKIENRPFLYQTSFSKINYPAIGFKINL